MRIQKILVILTTVASVNLVSCASSGSSADGSIISVRNTRWSLVAFAEQSPVTDTSITVHFDNDKMTGSDGCNRYNALYTMNEDKLNISRSIATTMMACSEAIMQQAASYKNALALAMAYKIDGSQLILLDGEANPLATFNKQSAELSGTSWQVSNMNNGKQAVTSLINNSKLTMNFGVDGKLTGSAGCNDYMAGYELAGKTVKLGLIGSTRKVCENPAGVMEQEAQFLTALATATTYQITGKTLELRTTDNALAIMLVRP